MSTGRLGEIRPWPARIFCARLYPANASAAKPISIIALVLGFGDGEGSMEAF